MSAAALAPAFREFFSEDSLYTFYISGGVTQDDVGKAVSLDTSTPMTVKLAADGDEIFGRFEVYESRLQDGTTLATIATEFMGALPLKDGETPNIGDTLIGGGSGTVKVRPVTALTGNAQNVMIGNQNLVVVVDNTGTASGIVGALLN